MSHVGTIVSQDDIFTETIEFETSEEGVWITSKLSLTSLAEVPHGREKGDFFLTWEMIQTFLDHKP